MLDYALNTPLFTTIEKEVNGKIEKEVKGKINIKLILF